LPDAEKFFDVSAGIYAHRGLWGGDIPENSLAAFRAARLAGIGVELDVRLTADGAPVVFHDATLERMCGNDRRLDQVTARDLAGLSLPDRSPIPTLESVLDEMEGLPVLLELKVDAPGDARIADIVAQMIAARGGALAVMSFDEVTVARLCQLIEDRLVGLLIDAESRIGAEAIFAKAAKARAMACDYLAPHFTSLEAASRGAGGLPLVAWTLRSPDELTIARKYGAAPIFEGFSPLQASGLAKPPETPI
jgi:glycerophosphoryl diester phosphodiesterase